MTPGMATLRLALIGAETNTWGTALEQLRNGINLPLWGGLLTTLAAVWWLSAIYLRRRGSVVRKIDNPQRLFRDLVRVHRLSWNETSLLEQLAEARGLEEAAILFVREDYFAVHDLEGEICEQAAAIAKLREKLFGSAELGTRNAEREGVVETAEPTSAA